MSPDVSPACEIEKAWSKPYIWFKVGLTRGRPMDMETQGKDPQCRIIIDYDDWVQLWKNNDTKARREEGPPEL
jgi:hypothetical protein